MQKSYALPLVAVSMIFAAPSFSMETSSSKNQYTEYVEITDDGMTCTTRHPEGSSRPIRNCTPTSPTITLSEPLEPIALVEQDDADLTCVMRPQTGSRIPARVCTSAHDRAVQREQDEEFIRDVNQMIEQRPRAN